jgi:spore coat polysaccharide biosynthesis protein SpsF
MTMNGEARLRGFAESLHKARAAIVLQARMSSRRLPGKMLLPLGKDPLVQWVIDRFAKRALTRQLWLATSSEASDDPLANYVKKEGVQVFRGDLENVAARLLALGRQENLASIIRISADSPFIDVDLVADVFALSQNGSVFATNVFPRSFPKGQSVEVIPADLLHEHHQEMTPEDREHVTTFFYRNADRFRIVNHSHTEDLNHIRMVADTSDDWTRLQSVASRLTRPHWEYDWREFAELFSHHG